MKAKAGETKNPEKKGLKAFLKSNRLALILLFVAAAASVVCWYMSQRAGSEAMSLSDLPDRVFPQTAFTVSIGGKVFPISESVVNAWIASGVIIVLAILFRLFIVPKMAFAPNKIQVAAEELVISFCRISKDARHCAGGIAPIVFVLSAFICVSTLPEIVGIRPPLADINTAIAVAAVTTFLINYYAFKEKKWKRLQHYRNPLNIIIDLSVPISLTFHLFGSMLAGTLIMGLLDIVAAPVLPAILGLLFVVVHAVLQAYIFAMLTSTFLGEAAEYHDHAH